MNTKSKKMNQIIPRLLCVTALCWTPLTGQIVTPISQLPYTLTSPAAGDLLPIVDISDSTQSVNGTTKKTSLTTLRNYFLGASATLPVANGGTGQTTSQAAIDALLASSGALSQGDVWYYNGADVVRLAAGTAGSALVTGGVGANPSWGGTITLGTTAINIGDTAAALLTFTTVGGNLAQAAGVSSAVSIQAKNTTAPSEYVNTYNSPRVRIAASNNISSGGPLTKALNFDFYSEATTGTTAPNGKLYIKSNVDGGADTLIMTLFPSGSVYVPTLIGSDLLGVGDLLMVGESSSTLQLNIDAAGTGSRSLKSNDSTGTNGAAPTLVIAGGRSTGTGISGDVITKTAVTGTTGSALNLYTTREYFSAKSLALTESTATTFANLSVAANKYLGAQLVCTVTANDGTNYQAKSDSLLVNAVNKTGVVTTTITASTNTTASSSAATLTCTYTAVANGESVDVKCNAVSSLTQTVLTIKFAISEIGTDSTDSAIGGGHIVTPQ